MSKSAEIKQMVTWRGSDQKMEIHKKKKKREAKNEKENKVKERIWK